MVKYGRRRRNRDCKLIVNKMSFREYEKNEENETNLKVLLNYYFRFFII